MLFKKVLKVVNSINYKVCYISMVSLFVLMVMTTVNTVIRKLGIGGIVDAFDMTGLLMILMIFCALAFQESGKEHIRVDMFVEMMPRVGKLIVNTFLDLLTIGALGYLSYAYFIDVGPSYTSGAASQVLKIPEWPFKIVVAVSVALFAITVLLNMIDSFLPKEPEESSGDDSEDSAVDAPEESPS